jgi:hypothetical protein
LSVITGTLFCYSEFCAGAGQLHVFCPQASELLDQLLTNGRVRRLLSSPLPSPPPLHHGARRLSRSESDLLCFRANEFSAMDSPGQHCRFLRHKGVLERSHSSSRTSATSDDYVQATGGKVRTLKGASLPYSVCRPNWGYHGSCVCSCFSCSISKITQLILTKFSIGELTLSLSEFSCASKWYKVLNYVECKILRWIRNHIGQGGKVINFQRLGCILDRILIFCYNTHTK